MSSTSPQPMSGHFLWTDFTETHIPNLFTGFANVPRNKLLLFLVTRYVDPATNEEILFNGSVVGAYIHGFDNYYVNSFGNPPHKIQFAYWNDPYTSNSRTTLYDLTGYSMETSTPSVRIGTFPTTRIWKGGGVSDAQWNQAVEWASGY